MEKILFQYKSTCSFFPPFLRSSDKVGSSITIYESGCIVYGEYIRRSTQQPTFQDQIASIPSLASRIQKILDAHADFIATFPDDLGTFVLDAGIDSFILDSKKASGISIERTPEDELSVLPDEDDWIVDKKTAMCVNTVMDIYDEIAEVVNAHNLRITLEIGGKFPHIHYTAPQPK